MKRIYLAGPDVFREDSITWGKYLQTVCEEHGLTGLYPLDNDIAPRHNPQETAHAIAQANMQMIRQADGVVANLEPFRGIEPDSGTVFEVGVAIALGKPVWVYFPHTGDLLQQVPDIDAGRCAQGWLVEDFGLPRNLMLACQWHGYSPTVEEAIAEMAQLLG
ncbi:nucleoside 2-deoxyribosyltransferase [Neopusillimonas aromaticivorans]|uniref:nucleoside 2-deoxyribosyltransferase n=1 Tax=Neopusillimonas aromaticivorans TaxID=2979868 RepID=UPI00259419B4|nr:nucleoside 2-deoxyribosyltransferase [Neopusillimonas aromaticivorans]WJJ93956.1 nucleoside 2-deoxyribosyltransferase [Neopusillimonas aromaticivorans]